LRFENRSVSSLETDRFSGCSTAGNFEILVAARVGQGVFGALLAKHVTTERPKLDIPGTLVVSAALFAIVYGFAHAESSGWTDPVTLGCLIGGVILLAVFVWLEARVAHPLQPLRLVLDRTRGGSFLAVFVMGMGCSRFSCS
jgi:hypothetical protein